ncbi:transthyretin/hydroxyisourate hydrolase family protein [Rhodotorula toruloides]|uniref:hydroxyisourate hydrolase n=1 Tax=Rhodotorula toruloides TaxID=5286 RepID=A0A511K900_RHOTO|nr:transthyretin/hydroxyisourate hydrolase family protein [Rhodotorula toruloides]
MQNSHLFGAYNVYAQQQPTHSGAQQQQGLAAAFGQPQQYGQPQPPGAQQQQGADISLAHLQQQHGQQQQQQQGGAVAGAGASGVGLHGHPEADDDDDDDEGDSGVHVTPSGATKKKAAGGRPRDKVWELFDGDRDVARCRWCSWKTDHPKAFRMRAHVQQCELIPQEKKDELERFQHDKEERLQAKKERAEARAAAGAPAPKKVKRDNAGEIVVGTGTPKQRMALPHGGRSPITCHVLDSTSGKPAPDMRIRLDRLNTTGFVLQAQGMTDSDGRCNTLLPPGTHLEIGIFKITFFTNEYFTKRGILSFYPFIEIPFEVKSADEHYHIPCLLSPYSYTTYRGS